MDAIECGNKEWARKKRRGSAQKLFGADFDESDVRLLQDEDDWNQSVTFFSVFCFGEGLEEVLIHSMVLIFLRIQHFCRSTILPLMF